MTQPYVVDLLISFCYSSAAAFRLRQYPVGMDLIVPETDILAYINDVPNSTKEATTSLPEQVPSQTVKFDDSQGIVLFPDTSKPCPVSVGGWLMLSEASKFSKTSTSVTQYDSSILVVGSFVLILMILQVLESLTIESLRLLPSLRSR